MGEAGAGPPHAGAPLVFIIGAPAVGKMTVGRALERLTGLPLFHNHMSIELVLPFFDFGSPAFNRLVGDFRRQIFEEVAASGRGMIFTWVWAFDLNEDRRFVDETVATFRRHGTHTVFAELRADLETRLHRNGTEQRLREKASKRDVTASSRRLLDLDARHRLTLDGEAPFADWITIDNTLLPPEDVAARIATRFDLPRVTGSG
jgi:hypothetical protein